MYQHFDFTDRQQRRDSVQRRRDDQCVAVGEKDFYDPKRSTDVVEYYVVRSYTSR